MPYASFVITDFMHYIVDKMLGQIDDVGFTLSLPGGMEIPLSHGPDMRGQVYLFYYLSFGEIGYDDWRIVCEHAPSCFWHECNPCGSEIVDIGCPFWCYLTHGAKFKLTFENLRDTAKTMRARVWQLRTWERHVPFIHEAFDDYIRQKGLRSEIEALRKSIDNLSEVMRMLRTVT